MNFIVYLLKRAYVTRQVRLSILMFFLLLVGSEVMAQEGYPNNGAQDKRQNKYAFIGATVYIDYNTIVEGATMLIENGKILEVGKGIEIPADAVQVDVNGMYIYPSFIDPYSIYGQPEVVKKSSGYREKNVLGPVREGAFGWNDALKADYSAIGHFNSDKKKAEELRKSGFGLALIFRPDGVVRGGAALVALGDAMEEEMVAKGEVATMLSFDKGTSKQDYPATTLGASALLRQTFYDLDWYEKGGQKETYNQNLEDLARLKGLPMIIEGANNYECLLADKIATEFGLSFIIKGTGREYQRLNELKSINRAFIVPLDFPKPYDVAGPYEALEISLNNLKHWEMAPANAGLMEKAGIDFMLSPYGMKPAKDFLANLRKSVEYGLSKQGALKALSYTPARVLGELDQVGSLKPDRWANFIIANGDLFDDNTVILENWVKGNKYEVEGINAIVKTGKYKVQAEGLSNFVIEVNGKPGAYKATFYKDTIKLKDNSKLANAYLSSFCSDSVHTYSFNADYIGGQFKGMVKIDGANWAPFVASYEGKASSGEDEKVAVPIEYGEVLFPFTSYGNKVLPTKQKVLFKNATVWTNEAEGVLNNADVLVDGGKIVKIGQGIEDNTAVAIDASGKHLTSGIIDEHSHIALFSVNEWTQSVSSEVRMADVVNPEDINIYRQLSGGVTTSQLLHGSANPIGGQSAIIKLKWGGAANDLLLKGADPFIKFALGENVKQSNQTYLNTTRFPQTRMGVEQIYVDAFTRSKEYGQKWKEYNALSAKTKLKVQPPRVDLELEALVEILNKKRFITCHSYVQSEINMLMKVADQFGFKVNTFTHILEGYKVADKMKMHGVAGSTFSDWWAYKYEVKDAIPYNAALMTKVGVLSAINSDDAEMGRRLNQEAAKTIKYGGLSEEEAWKLVTLNPAKILHLDHRIGSIKEGKDADLVLWTNNPLSIYAKVEKTMVEGAFYYDADLQNEKMKAIEEEKDRILSKMLLKAKDDKDKQIVAPQSPENHHCDFIN